MSSVPSAAAGDNRGDVGGGAHTKANPMKNETNNHHSTTSATQECEMSVEKHNPQCLQISAFIPPTKCRSVDNRKTVKNKKPLCVCVYAKPSPR